MYKHIIIFLFFIFYFSFLFAQDTLPNFTVIDKKNNHIQIKWINPYSTCNQILIQRSFDSSKNFRTIFAVPSPKLPINGYTDNNPPNNNMFYRIFYVLEGGNYFFSIAKRPENIDVFNKKDNVHSIEYNLNNRRIIIQKMDSTIEILDAKQYQRFKDSILFKTKDTLFSKTFDTILLKTFVPKEIFLPSIYVFTEKEGNVKILLPDIEKIHYQIYFFEIDGTPLFEIKHIRDPFLILDKTNFIHAGWFKFELYEDGKLKERNKLYIPKDF